MSSDREQLVQAITEQVLVALRDHTGELPGRSNAPGPGAGEGGGSPSSAPSGTPNGSQPHAAIRPPIGVCTGDYSQFPELRRRPGTSGSSAVPGNGTGQPNHAQSPAPAGHSASHTPTSTSGTAPAPAAEGGPAASAGGNHDAETLAGIVTATRLEEAAKRTSGRVIRLSPEAQLSPLAADRVRDLGLHVQRTDSPNGATGNAPRSADTWLWWIEGRCPAVQQITDAMSPALRPLARRRESSALAETVAELARQTQRGDAAGGLLFVPSAARAACFANRCASLRAVVGTCEQAVAEGVELLGANVLIVEYPHQAPETMRRMVERFVCAPRNGTPAVDRELRELSRCV